MRDTWCPFSVIISVCPLQISTSIQNFFATLCFGGTFDASIGSEDLWSQRRTCSCMYNMYSALILSCFVYNAYNSKVGLLLNSTCTQSLVLCILACCFSTLHALGHGFEGGLPWRIPAPCTVHPPGTIHRAPCNVHRAPCTHRAKPHHRQSRGLSRKIWTAPPLLQRPFIPTADAGPASQISIRSDRSL